MPPETELTPGRRRQVFWLLLFLAGTLRLAFVWVTPAWHAPDEYAHFWYAQQIAHENRLPVSHPSFPEFEAFQPPLYYVLASLPLRAWDEPLSYEERPAPPPGPLVAVRLLSVALALATLGLAYRLFLSLPGMKPDFALWGVGFMAFLPTFAGLGGTVSNDALVILPATLCLYFCVRHPWTNGTALLIGAMAGLAILTKMNGLVLLPFIAYMAGVESERGSSMPLKRVALILAGLAVPMLLLAARNLIQYDDLLGLNPGVGRDFELTVGNSVRAVRNLSWSFWLALGRGYKTQLPPMVYLLTALPLMLLAIAGWGRVARRRLDLLAPAGVALVAALAGSLWYTFSYPAGTMTSWGKNLFPVLPMIAALMVLGWKAVWPQKAWVVPTIGLSLMFAGCLWGLLALSHLT